MTITEFVREWSLRRLFVQHTSISALILCACFVLKPQSGAAQSTVPIDSVPRTHWTYAISAGYGAVSTSLGAEYSIDLMHGHFLLSLRGGASLPDDGSYQSSGDPSFTIAYAPKEYVSDLAILAGYRAHGNSGWLSLSGGPTYISGILRGKNFISADTSQSAFFSGSKITRHYSSSQLNSLGLTIQTVGGFILASWLGVGLGISVTSSLSYTYAAVFMSVYFGWLR